MFEEFMGLPAHPLLIHAVVVLVPVQILTALAYAFVPFVRRYITWLVVVIAVIAPSAAFAAKLSGQAFRDRKIRNGAASPEILTKIDQHRNFGDKALYASLILSVLMLLLMWQVLRTQRAADGAGGTGGAGGEAGRSMGAMVINIVLVVAVVGFSAVTGYYIYKTGDSGARMVWGGQ